MSDERPFKGSGGSLRAQIYEDIRDRIHRGALGANDRLVDVEIAGNLGVSRMPVREALLQLTHEGYLVGTTRGFMLPTLTPTDVANIFEVRRCLEPCAAAHAARTLDTAGMERLAAHGWKPSTMTGWPRPSRVLPTMCRSCASAR